MRYREREREREANADQKRGSEHDNKTPHQNGTPFPPEVQVAIFVLKEIKQRALHQLHHILR
jgi:hypothetical protein